jgi:hypothetical protein
MLGMETVAKRMPDYFVTQPQDGAGRRCRPLPRRQCVCLHNDNRAGPRQEDRSEFDRIKVVLHTLLQPTLARIHGPAGAALYEWATIHSERERYPPQRRIRTLYMPARSPASSILCVANS